MPALIAGRNGLLRRIDNRIGLHGRERAGRSMRQADGTDFAEGLRAMLVVGCLNRPARDRRIGPMMERFMHRESRQQTEQRNDHSGRNNVPA